MTSLFSTFENPARQMRWVILGSALGAAAAMAAHFLVLPLADTSAGRAALTMPFILLGPLVMSHRRMLLAGMDYCMVYLLLINPTLQVDGAASLMLAQVFAVLMGPAIALAAFSFAFPTDTSRRYDFLLRLIVQDLQKMAMTGRKADAWPAKWRARLYHRILRLVRWSEMLGRQGNLATDGGLAALGVGEAIIAARGYLDGGTATPASRRALRAALMSMAKLRSDPSRVAETLNRAGVRLHRLGTALPVDLRETATLVSSNQQFFRSAA